MKKRLKFKIHTWWLMYQLKWATKCPDIWWNGTPGMFRMMLLDEVNN